ncbi:hypothetical protein GW17_00023634, partial [Ensete ventricosum]
IAWQPIAGSIPSSQQNRRLRSRVRATALLRAEKTASAPALDLFSINRRVFRPLFLGYLWITDTTPPRVALLTTLVYLPNRPMPNGRLSHAPP